MSWWSDFVKAVQEAVTSAAGGEQQAELQAGGAPNVSTPWGAITGLIEGIWADATNGKMWRSLGWILLGIVLMLLGVGWWIGPSAARMSPAGAVARQLS
jgi:hypothetical protein